MRDSGYQDIWHYFGLSYSAYLILPRAILCDMPHAWQMRFLDLIEELENSYDTDKFPSNYMVRAKEGNRFITDPFSNYKHVKVAPYRKKKA